jgi:hypothetical protein
VLPLVITIGLIVGALGIGGYLLLRDDDEPDPGPEPTDALPTSDLPTVGPSEGCAPVEHPEDLGTAHLAEGEEPPEYSSDPPASGPHDPSPTEAGVFYDSEQPNPQLIHAMEHGAVIFWTNGLSEAEDTEFRDAVNEVFSQGYRSLIGVPYPALEGKVAMTAWGTLQVCDQVDPAAIEEFVAAFYGSGGEGILACQDPASESLPACERWLSPPTESTA